MKVMILAGGYGTRLSEETQVIPKPMVELGGRPILWHIMKHYSHFGCSDFIILLGYRGHVIKQFFANYFLSQSSVTFDLANNRMEVVQSAVEPWRVTLLDTGIDTLTGGRIRQAQRLVDGERFMLTYGDGLCDIDLDRLERDHAAAGRLCTLTAIRPAGRFGAIEIDDGGQVHRFNEKAGDQPGWINGGFFVCEPGVFDYLPADRNCMFEREPLEGLAEAGELHAHRHRGFWKCMDTLADKNALEQLWQAGDARWKLWDER